ncbi:MAG: hypothetical protein IPN24_18465 [Betaproteobacteria bacterium]|nr:hypothetical protein [Betaproteobacteria bacterium]
MANALATQGAQEFDGGLVDPSGKFVENVKDARRRQLQSSEFLLGQGDRRLTADMAAADRAEGRQIQREDRASAAEFRKLQAAHLRAQTAALGQKPDPVSVVPEGSALFNRATGNG